jgi:hypothetical protein
MTSARIEDGNLQTAMAAPATTRTRIEPDFDPQAVRHLKAATGRDLTVGGPTLGAQSITAGLVDEYHLFVWPTGSGSSWSCWTSAGSAAARCTCATAPRHEQAPAAPKPDSDPPTTPEHSQNRSASALTIRWAVVLGRA